MLDDGDGPNVKARAREQFSALSEVWPARYRWSTHTKSEIARHLRDAFVGAEHGLPDIRLLNIGSHGNAYGLEAALHVHVDLASAPLSCAPIAVVADAELLPFRPESFDAAICVGSVINYCNPPEVIGQVARVLKVGGRLALEYETSESFEFVLTKDFGRDVALVRTFYNGDPDRLYVYSMRYVASALSAAGFAIESVSRFHRLSSLAYLVTGAENFSARFAKFDRTLARLPIIRDHSANVFVVAQKKP